MKSPRFSSVLAAVVVSLAGGEAPARAAEAPQVRELRTQRVGGTTYFQVRFEMPEGIQLPHLERWNHYANPDTSPLARLPRLVPQDGKTRCVYLRLVLREGEQGIVRAALPRLEFVGKVAGAGEAKFLLLYPTGMRKADPRAAVTDPEKLNPARWLPRYDWAEVPVRLDFRKARPVAIPAETNRRGDPASREDDLEALWASGQAARFAVLEALTPEFGFYSFARAATGRKYRVPAPALGKSVDLRDREAVERRLYENTIPAAVVARTLALRRLLVPDTRAGGERTIDVREVEGIPAVGRDWEALLGDKQPAPEPLARLVPQDNYYLEFKNIGRLIELGELLDQWGTPLSRALQPAARDDRARERLERQLCTKTDFLAKTLGPLVVKGMAVTGSDGYLREGSDVTMILHTTNKGLLLLGQNQLIEAARKEFGERLRSGKEEYHQVTIESFVTPLREVSLYRAAVGDFVLQSNSLAGLKRVIDTQQGRRKSLADAPDFRYLRTIFPAADQGEDGFLFLSDAFLRRQAGPALKIKEKRRLEALTGLFMTSHAALFDAWETGKLPADRAELLAGAGLKKEEVEGPEGKGITWDARRQVAVSPLYNTLEFATPLVEIPLGKITEDERRSFEEFRKEYLTLWRQYLDPVGFRLTVRPREVRMETCVLPLFPDSAYAGLRRLLGGGTITVDSGTFHPKALVEFLAHLTPMARDRDVLRDRLPRRLGGRAINLLGRFLTARLEDGPAYLRLTDLACRRELDPDAPPVSDEELLGTLARVPLLAGMEVKRPRLFAGLLLGLRAVVGELAPDVDWQPAGAYRGVPIFRVGLPDRLFTGKEGGRDAIHITLFYALFEGNLKVSLGLAPLKGLIDGAARRGQEGERGEDKAVKVNATLRVSPAAAGPATRKALRFLLEWRTQRGALANEPALYALYHTGVLAGDASPRTVATACMRFFGSVPVTADNSPFVYEARTDEVNNRRHGSVRQPRLHEGVEPGSPLGKLLEQLQSVRADLRFEEDGVHAVVTIERQAAKQWELRSPVNLPSARRSSA